MLHNGSKTPKNFTRYKLYVDDIFIDARCWLVFVVLTTASASHLVVSGSTTTLL